MLYYAPPLAPNQLIWSGSRPKRSLGSHPRIAGERFVCILFGLSQSPVEINLIL